MFTALEIKQTSNKSLGCWDILCFQQMMNFQGTSKERNVDFNNLYSTGIPNFNVFLSSKINMSRKATVQQMTADASSRRQIIYIDKFSEEVYETPERYIENKLDFVLQAVRQEIPFEIHFNNSSTKPINSIYGLPLAIGDKKIGSKTNNTVMFINVVKELNDIIKHNKIAVLRDVYYKNVSIYDKNQANFTRMTNKLSKISKIDRSSFNLMASQKGEYFCFSNLIVESTTSCNYPYIFLNQSKNLIPTCFYGNFEDYNCLSGDNVPDHLLIVEKDAVFSDIFNNINPVFLKRVVAVTGRGQPDQLSKNFVKVLAKCRNMKKISILTDLDPYGAYIALNYMTAIFETFIHLSYFKPQVEYMGVKFLDLMTETNSTSFAYKDSKKFLPYTFKDYKIGLNAVKKITSSHFFSEQQAVRDLLYESQRQLFFGFKSELNSLSDGNFSTWIEQKLISY